MALEEQIESSGKLYVRLAQKKEEKRGLFYKKNGSKTFVNAVSGQIINIKKTIAQPREGDKWAAFAQFEIELQDMNSDPSNIVLVLKQDSYQTDRILNSLASITTPTQVDSLRFSAWEKEGQLNVFVSGAEKQADGKYPKLDWKFQWDSNAKDFTGVPGVITHVIGKDAAGKDKTIDDRTARDAFFEAELNRVCILLTGKPIAGTNQSAPASFKDALMAKVKKECTSHAILLDKWSNMVKVISEKTSSSKEFDECMGAVQEYLNTLTKGYVLKVDGTHTFATAPSSNSSEVDDLPF